MQAGPTYVHCEKCKRCVKSSWKHCDQCRTCELPGRHTLCLKQTGNLSLVMTPCGKGAVVSTIAFDAHIVAMIPIQSKIIFHTLCLILISTLSSVMNVNQIEIVWIFY